MTKSSSFGQKGSFEHDEAVVSVLTLGALYEAILAFSSENTFASFWKSVCQNVRWIVPSKRLALCLRAEEGRFDCVGRFERGRFSDEAWADLRPSSPSIADAMRAELPRVLSPPWSKIGEDDAFCAWLLAGAVETVFVLPLSSRAERLGCLVFATGVVSESDQKTLVALGTVYALHVGLIYRLLLSQEGQRKTEHELFESRMRYRSLFQHLGDAVLLHDREGRILEVNERAVDMFGYSAAELVGKYVIDLRDSPEKYAIYQARRDLLLKEKSIRFESTYRRKEGHVFAADVNAALITLDGEEMIQAIFRDITEQQQTMAELTKARDEAQAAARARETFLANVSHELRTPLNAIIGYTELLLEEFGDAGGAPRVELTLNKILFSGRHLLKLINELLDLSKIRAGEFTFEARFFDVRAMLSHVADIAGTLASKGKNHFHLRLGEGLGLMKGDELRIRQILLNLISNACKFTVSGDITLLVEAYEREGDGPSVYLRFSVADTGVGISADKHEEIFKPFSQAHVNLTHAYGGTGLGLAVSRALARAMSGELSMKSIVGKGSVFVLELPRGDTPQGAIASS